MLDWKNNLDNNINIYYKSLKLFNIYKILILIMYIKNFAK